MELSTPKDDGVVERHQFYASIVGVTQRNSRDNNGLGKKLYEFESRFEQIRDEVRDSATRSKTVIASAIFIWSIVGGGVGVYLTRGLQSIDSIIARVGDAEKKLETIAIFNEQRRDVPEKIDQIKRSIIELQRNVDEISTKHVDAEKVKK